MLDINIGGLKCQIDSSIFNSFMMFSKFCFDGTFSNSFQKNDDVNKALELCLGSLRGYTVLFLILFMLIISNVF